MISYGETNKEMSRSLDFNQMLPEQNHNKDRSNFTNGTTRNSKSYYNYKPHKRNRGSLDYSDLTSCAHTSQINATYTDPPANNNTNFTQIMWRETPPPQMSPSQPEPSPSLLASIDPSTYKVRSKSCNSRSSTRRSRSPGDYGISKTLETPMNPSRMNATYQVNQPRFSTSYPIRPSTEFSVNNLRNNSLYNDITNNNMSGINNSTFALDYQLPNAASTPKSHHYPDTNMLYNRTYSCNLMPDHSTTYNSTNTNSCNNTTNTNDYNNKDYSTSSMYPNLSSTLPSVNDMAFVNCVSQMICAYLTRHVKQLNEIQQKHVQELQSSKCGNNNEEVKALQEQAVQQLLNMQRQEVKRVRLELVKKREELMCHPNPLQLYPQQANSLCQSLGEIVTQIIKEQFDVESLFVMRWEEEGNVDEQLMELRLFELHLLFNKQFYDLWEVFKDEFVKHVSTAKRPSQLYKRTEIMTSGCHQQQHETTAISAGDKSPNDEVSQIANELLLVQSKRMEELNRKHENERMHCDDPNELQQVHALEAEAIKEAHIKEFNEFWNKYLSNTDSDFQIIDKSVTIQNGNVVEETQTTFDSSSDLQHAELTQEANKILREMQLVQSKRAEDLHVKQQLQMSVDPNNAELRQKLINEEQSLIEYHNKEMSQLKQRLKLLLNNDDVSTCSSKEASEQRARTLLQQMDLRQTRRMIDLRNKHHSEMQLAGDTNETRNKHHLQERILGQYHSKEREELEQVLEYLSKSKQDASSGSQSHLTSNNDIEKTSHQLTSTNDITKGSRLTSTNDIQKNSHGTSNNDISKGKVAILSTQPVQSKEALCKCIIKEAERSCQCSPLKINPKVALDFESNGYACLCNSIMPSLRELKDMEMQEQDELLRSLRRWQVARRDVISSMSISKKKSV